ncbi:MAG: hypothetical protein PHO29_13810 [Acetobacterium sp.]|nr:hypothetical protein [Acetobacterium sp.]
MIKLIPQMVYSLNIKKGYKKIENFDYLTKNAPEINKQLMLDMLKKKCRYRIRKTLPF